MELILWRHAEAEAGEPDEGRQLTTKGHKQAARMAQWLEHTLPSTCRILSSPALRAVQTAEALKRKFKIHAELAPDASPGGILRAANWPDAREPVLIVGHQPSLGRTAALLIGGSEQDWSIRKGNIWWIVQREKEGMPEHYLRAVMTPELLGK